MIRLSYALPFKTAPMRHASKISNASIVSTTRGQSAIREDAKRIHYATSVGFTIAPGNTPFDA
jgi:hypothetical protein